MTLESTAHAASAGTISALWAAGMPHEALAAAFIAAMLSRLWSRAASPDSLKGWARAALEFAAVVLLGGLLGMWLGDALATYATAAGVKLSVTAASGLIGAGVGFFLQAVVDAVRGRISALGGSAQSGGG